MSLAELIEHHVDDRDPEWFTGCKLNHIATFPYHSYDIIRTVLALLCAGNGQASAVASVQ